MLYSHNHNQSQQYIFKCKYTTHIQIQMQEQSTSNTQATLLFRYEPFINFWLRFFDTRREIQFLKVFHNHTMLTTSFNGQNPTLCPNGRNSTIIFHGPTSKSQLPGRTPLLHTMVGLNFSTPSWSDPNFNCLPQRQTTQLSVYIAQSQLPTDLFLKIFKFSGPSLPSMTSFILQPHFLSGVYYDNCDCHILCMQA